MELPSLPSARCGPLGRLPAYPRGPTLWELRLSPWSHRRHLAPARVSVLRPWRVKSESVLLVIALQRVLFPSRCTSEKPTFDSPGGYGPSKLAGTGAKTVPHDASGTWPPATHLGTRAVRMCMTRGPGVGTMRAPASHRDREATAALWRDPPPGRTQEFGPQGIAGTWAPPPLPNPPPLEKGSRSAGARPFFKALLSREPCSARQAPF